MRPGFRALLGACGALLLLLFAGGVVLSSPEGLRRLGQGLVSAALHRPVRFASFRANLLTASPTIHAEGVVVTSPARITHADLLHARTLDAELDWIGLLAGRLSFRRLQLDQPELHLVRLAPDENNYSFGQGGAGAALRSVISLSAVSGRVIYEDPQRHLSLAGAFSHDPQGGPQALHLQGGGVASGQPFTAAIVGAQLNGRAPTDPYGVFGHLVDGETNMAFSGTTQRPFDVRGFDLVVKARGPNLADFHYLLNLDPVNSAPFSLSGRAVKSNHLTHITQLLGQVGQSDVSGEITVDDRGPRRKISARLRAGVLHLGDVAALLSSAPAHGVTRSQPGHGEAAAGSGPVSDKPFSIKALRAKALDLDIQAGSVEGAGLPISNLRTHILLAAGKLSFAPLDLQVGGGQLRATASLDARGAMPRASIDAALTHASLGLIRPSPPGAADGQLSGRLMLSGAGSSPAALAARLSGSAAVAVAGGRLARGQADALGGDLFKGLVASIAGARSTVRLQCAGGDSTIADGIVSLKDVHIFTEVGETAVTGTADLAHKSLSLRLTPQPRPGDPAQTATPILISGAFAKPKVAADVAGAVTHNGVGALVKLAVSPATGLLPKASADFSVECARMAEGVR